MKAISEYMKHILLSLLLLNFIFPISCQSTKATTQESVWDGKPGEFKAMVLGTLRPGEPFVVAAAGTINGVTVGKANMQAALVKDGTQLNRGVLFNLQEVSRRGPVNAAIMGVPVTAGFGKAAIRIEAQGRLLQTLDVVIEERHFKSESFSITQSMTDMLTQPHTEERKRQAEQLWATWARTGDTIYTEGNFIMPVNSNYQTSLFGFRRTYRYTDGRSSSSIHEGIDYRAATGTPIYAPAPGKIVLAMNRIVTGNSVAIEHMPGVYSLFYHMDKLSVAEGDIVQTGNKVGEAGSTGFSTGSHLHWEIRVATIYVDPEKFLGRKVLDKEAILAILNE